MKLKNYQKVKELFHPKNDLLNLQKT